MQLKLDPVVRASSNRLLGIAARTYCSPRVLGGPNNARKIIDGMHTSVVLTSKATAARENPRT
jgi:hypothetical protein